MNKKTKIISQRPGLMIPSYHEDIARGKVPGRTAVRRFGHNEACAATEETVWEGSALYVYLTAPERLQVSSSDVADAIAGTGARTVFLKGLSGAYRIITETVQLASGASVQTTKRFLRLFMARVMTAGTGGKNAGAISVKNNAETNTLALMPIGENQSHAAIWTVPAGMNFVVTARQGGEVAAKVSHIFFYVRTYGSVWQLKRSHIVKDTHFYIHMAMPWVYPEKTDIEVRATATAGSGVVFGGFNGYYEKEGLE